jgi:hypothetical protein
VRVPNDKYCNSVVDPLSSVSRVNLSGSTLILRDSLQAQILNLVSFMLCIIGYNFIG